MAIRQIRRLISKTNKETVEILCGMIDVLSLFAKKIGAKIAVARYRIVPKVRGSYMKLMIRAACLSDPGRDRRKNEDNFYFGGYCMPETTTGLRKPAYICREAGDGMWLVVFDGMGGESSGETATFAAASEMR